MIVTHKLEADLVEPHSLGQIHAVQGDDGTRAIALSLTCAGESWAIPEGITAAMRYRKSDGTKGFYDTMPDGTRAWFAEESTLTMFIAPQMLTIPGAVHAQVVLMNGTQILASFTLQINVQENPAAGILQSEDYVTMLGWMEQELDQRLAEARDSGSFTGPQGEQGIQGIQGEPGKSAYAYAQEGGFSGTEAQFAQKLAAEYLPVSGGAMGGSIAMNGHAITGLAISEDATSAATRGYVDALAASAKDAILQRSATQDSEKIFHITVDDSGTLTAEEVE